jgi:hypothetical protein
VSDYADPDLETVAPLPPLPPAPGAGHDPAPPHGGRGPAVAIVAAMIVVSLVVGFGVATVVLNARDKSTDDAATSPVLPTTPATLTPGNTSPGSSVFPVVPGTTPPTSVPADPEEAALGSLILRQSDVAATDVVALIPHGADLTAATLDLCNGTFPSETQRSARRQVALFDTSANVVFSTEAVLYRAPADSAQAFGELQSVSAKCPPTPVPSPVGEDTTTTTFGAAPDGSWARTTSVSRLAYSFHTVDATAGDSSNSIAVYLRRGRALMGVYFNQPTGVQAAVDGRTTVAGIVAVFEARMAALPASVVNG